MVLSIGVAETRQTAVNWRDIYNISSPILVDAMGEVYEPFSLGLFPLNVILDETFTIRYQEIHFNEFEIRNMLTALSEPLVKIRHTPLLNTEDDDGDYTVSAEIRSGDPLQTEDLKLFWETDTNSGEVLLADAGDDVFTGMIPRQDPGTEVRYYIRAESSNARVAFHPNRAPGTTHAFHVLVDTSPPVIDHVPYNRWRGDLWSPKITAQITDDLTVASAELEYRVNGNALVRVPMSRTVSGEWQAWFTQSAVSGDIVEYRIRAVDVAVAANTGISPDTGFYEMTIIDPIPALVLDLDGNQSSGPVIGDALTSAGVSLEYVTEWPASLDHYRSLWISMGVGANMADLSFDHSTLLEEFMESGNPVYLECGDCWTNPERLNSINLFNARAGGDNFAIAGQLEGLDDTLGHGLVFDYSGDSGGVNPLMPVSRSEPVFRSADPEFITAIVSTSGAGRTVASTFEIGGLVDATGVLVERYADFFGLIDLATCDEPAVTLEIPSDHVEAGEAFRVRVTVCNPEFREYQNVPLFVILDVQGALFFWPTFSEFDYQEIHLEPGEEVIQVIPEFIWPAGTGTGSATWYAAMTDPEVTEIFGTFDVVEFGW